MKDEPLMRVLCKEKGGDVVREIRLASLSTEKLRHYYDNLKQFRAIFNDHVNGSFERFANLFLSQNVETGALQPRGLIWEVDDVGILFLTEVDEVQGEAHFTFWDRRLKGRENLIIEMVRYVFMHYKIHRIETRVALYATPIMLAVERMGFKAEGRLRDAILYEGEWFDVNVYSILSHEVLDAAEDRKSPA